MKNLPEIYKKNIITRLINKIVSGDFDDLTVRELLIELRDYSENNSLFRELANFITHPIERIKGMIFEYILS